MLWIYGLIGLFIIGWYLFDGSNEAPLPQRLDHRAGDG